MLKSRLFTFTLTILFLIGSSAISCKIDDDLVKNLPDYPYKGRMFSGYLNLSNPIKKLHYLFVESERSKEKDPLILWLNGGPGCSSLLGWSQEHGPASFKENSAEFKLNLNSWNRFANVLYLESPAGVGFSTIASYKERDWAVDDQSSGKQNLEALLDFLQKFPSYQNNDLYISGESYAGIYVPILVSNILDWNKVQMFDHDKIRIKGMMIGNGVTDWQVDTEPAMIDFAFSHSLYSNELREYYLQHCKEEINHLRCKDARKKIRDMIDNVNIYDIYRECFNQKQKKPDLDDLSFSDLKGVESTPKYNKYEYTPWLFEDLSPKKEENGEDFLQYLSEDSQMLYGNPPCIDSIGPDTYFNREDVKAALNVHVGLKWEMCSLRVGKSYIRDKSQGSYYLYPKLINSGIRILIYSGDTDAAVPFNGTQKWISNLKLPILSAWRSWRVDRDNLAGYRTIYDGLTFVVVKGTGHMVPQWKPKETFHMISSFLEGKDL